MAIASAETLTGMRVGSARLSKLPPGARTGKHSDSGCPYRVHIPTTTSRGAFITLGEQMYHWQPGEMWLADFSIAHFASNDGEVDRVHLLLVLEQ